MSAEFFRLPEGEPERATRTRLPQWEILLRVALVVEWVGSWQSVQAPAKRCICWDEDFRQVYRDKYGVR